MASAQEEFNELMRDKDHRSQHPEDDEDADARSFLNISDDDDDDDREEKANARQLRTGAPDRRSSRDDSSARQSMSLARSNIPITRYDANTGPKGVIADAQNFRDSRRIHRNSVRSLSSLVNQAQTLSVTQTVATEKLSEEDDEDFDEELQDDDFVNKWRQSRLRQMQSGGHASSSLHSRTQSRKVYGSLTTVDGEGYLNAVDRSPPDTVVIVYIYDDYVGTVRSSRPWSSWA